MVEKGQHIPLLYTQEKRHRVVAGLSWDAREDEISLMGKIQGDSHHDLDLSAYVYDTDGDFVDLVTPEATEAIDESGAIYHSGDDQSGEGEGDDEAVSVELLNLPEDVDSIFFLVEAESNHFLGDIAEISMRIADGMTDKELLYIDIDPFEVQKSIAFIFARIYRNRKSRTGWMIHYIGEAPETDEITEWGEYFKRYLT